MTYRRAGKVTVIRIVQWGGAAPFSGVRVRRGRARPRLHVPGAAACGNLSLVNSRGEGRRRRLPRRRRLLWRLRHRHRRRRHRRRRPPWPLRRPAAASAGTGGCDATRCTRSSRATSARNVACVTSSWVDAARRCLASRAASLGTSARTGSRAGRRRGRQPARRRQLELLRRSRSQLRHGEQGLYRHRPGRVGLVRQRHGRADRADQLRRADLQEPSDGKLFLTGEARLFLDELDEIDNNYMFWGGLRYEWK